MRKLLVLTGGLWFGLSLLSLKVAAATSSSFPVEVLKPDTISAWLAQLDLPAGYVAQVGWNNGQPALQMAAQGRSSIHILEPDAGVVQAARQQLKAANLLGLVTVQWWPENYLPYPENTINLLFVNQVGAIPETEWARVTTPLGMYVVRQADGWRCTQKPWPAELDGWTHWRHDADGNMVSRDAALQPPTGVRWIAGPAQDAAGRKWYYDHVLVSAHGRNFYVYDDEIVARDAFNGRLLWQRPAKAYTFQEAGSPLFLKTGTRVSKVRPVAYGDRLYVALEGKLSALDGARGRIVQEFAEISAPREILVSNQRIILSDANGLRAFSTSAEKLWEIAQSPKRMAASAERLYFLAGNQITCVDTATGALRWRATHELADQAVTLTLGNNIVVLERSSWKDDAPGNGLLVFSADNGDFLWEKIYTPGMTHYKEARAFYVDDLLWIQGERQAILGLDPKTGKEKKRLPSRGLHCATPIATAQYFIAPELEFTDFKTGERARARMVKSACRLPFVPANGLLYTFPVQCECFPMLRGYMGLAQTPGFRSPTTERLQKGPAFGKITDTASPAGMATWPMYRRDVFRSNFQPIAAKGRNPRLLWSRVVAQIPAAPLTDEWDDNPFTPGWLTPPVCAEDRVLVAVPDQHLIQSLDANSGLPQWSFIAGGRVDGPPTISAGRALFGCHDGYLYCLRVTDGALVWRLRAAPQEQLHPAYGQMESLWPVVGSPLVENGIAYVAAGRHPASDGGVKVLAVSVTDGSLVWEQTITDMGIKQWYSGALPGSTQKVGVDYEPMDILVRDGGRLAMSRWQLSPENGKMNLALAQTNYVAFSNLEVPRGLWGYGIRQTKQVQPKLPAAFSPEKIVYGATNDAAVVLMTDTVIKASQNGKLQVGAFVVELNEPLVRDGLAVAGSRIYASGARGRLFCILLE